jgi:hypothetical protein
MFFYAKNISSVTDKHGNRHALPIVDGPTAFDGPYSFLSSHQSWLNQPTPPE